MRVGKLRLAVTSEAGSSPGSGSFRQAQRPVCDYRALSLSKGLYSFPGSCLGMRVGKLRLAVGIGSRKLSGKRFVSTSSTTGLRLPCPELVEGLAVTSRIGSRSFRDRIPKPELGNQKINIAAFRLLQLSAWGLIPWHNAAFPGRRASGNQTRQNSILH